MNSLRATLLMKGKGRRPTLPELKLTNKLLVQLYQLRIEARTSAKEVEKWFSKLFPHSTYPANRICRRIDRIAETARDLQGERLKNFLAEPVDLEFISDALHAVGVTRALDSSKFVRCQLTNGIVVDMGMFLLKEGFTYTDFTRLLSDLSLDGFTLSANDLRQRYMVAEKKRKKLVKRAKQDPSVLNCWLEEAFFPKPPSTISANAQLPSASPDLGTSEQQLPTAIVQASSENQSRIDTVPIQIDSATIAYSQLPSTSSEVGTSEQQLPTVVVHAPSENQNHTDSVMTQTDSATVAYSQLTSALSEIGTSEQQSNTALVQAPISSVHLPSDISTTVGISVNPTDQPRFNLRKVTPLDQTVLLERRVRSLEKDLKAVKKQLDWLVDKNQLLESENNKLQDTITRLKGDIESVEKSKISKQKYRLKQKCEFLEGKNHDLMEKVQLLEEQLGNVKKSKHLVQKRLSKTKKQCTLLKEQKANLDENAIAAILEGTDHQLQSTRDRRYNRFHDDVRLTIMGLQEAGVAASKCSSVISVVVRHLFKTEITDLPSASTSTNIADEAHFLSKVQSAECILASDNVTLHTDGTSRQKQRYVGQQVTLENKTLLNLGFSEVASEDSDTLLETTLALLEELSDIYCHITDEEKSDIFKKMLGNITSLMSDRAAVMTAFNHKFDEHKSTHTEKNTQVHFLYCNAHFLLGLSNSCEMALKSVEDKVRKEEGALGRESTLQFKNWISTEAATARLIRTAADVLGPRGDEKSGARSEWLAYCREEEINSEMTSYRSNRFNSLFENALAIFHHRSHIKNFLESFSSSSNCKLKNVLADITDTRLQSLLAAVALVNTYIAQPYWKLVNSKEVQYVDFHKYVQTMHFNLQLWSGEPEHLLKRECRGAFDGNFLGEVDTSVHDFAASHDLVLTALSHILSSILQVSQRQLKDFLQGGVFAQNASSSMRDDLLHCPLTNLSGEHAFGDLDYSMLIKRHASLHHHSTSNMLKRNETTAWLASKSLHDQGSLWQFSRKEAKSLRQKHRRQEECVKLRIQERIAENNRVKKEKEMKVAAEKQQVTEAIIKLGGLVKTPQDITWLLQHHSNTAQVLKDQLKYIKTVLGVKVKTSGSKAELLANLQEYVSGEAATSPPRKRRRIAESGSDSNDSELHSSDDNCSDVNSSQAFQFDRQGQWVAVYYDSKFYIGQVIAVESASSATIKFLSGTKCRDDYFKWPSAEDIATVDSTFVFKWDFHVVPVSSDGRMWHVSDIRSIADAYSRIKSSS